MKKAAFTLIRFRYEHLRNETHVELHRNFNALVDQFSAETLGIDPLYAVYKPWYDEEVTALDVIRKSWLTGEMKKGDRERGLLYRGFAGQVKSYRYHFDADRRKAAQALGSILKHYGNIERRRFYEKTAAIADLHRELVKPENFVRVTALGLVEWLEALAQANLHIEELFMARVDEAAQRPDIHMRSIRREVDKAFRSILDLLESLVRVKGEGTNKAFLAELNTCMTRYRDILAQEAGRRKAAVGSFQ
ncbi:MAG: DUF6261 family protein [Prevotellaceae bacterium]|jgi:hypothetical protein|nr:DUF6261 family protein [Prevotellaceae bacterium]